MTDLSIPLSQFVLALQSIVTRNVAATQEAVVSVGPIAAGEIGSANVVPSEAVVRGTTRAYDDAVHEMLVLRLDELARAQAEAFHCAVEVVHGPRAPVLVTSAAQTATAVRAAAAVVGDEKVSTSAPPSMAGEDFADLLAERPGAFVFLGAGVAPDGRFNALHTPDYDFNDDLLPIGAAYWVELVRAELG